jgi:alpha-tubulin suppressor-like RCC1 family protein
MTSPIQILFPSYTTLAATSGQFCSGVLTDGTLWSWGNGASGQLGDGTLGDYSFPIQVGTLSNWSKLSGYQAGMSAIKTDGTLWGWGANSYGQIGNGSGSSVGGVTQVGTLTNWGTIYTTARNTFSVKTDGTLWGWGANDFGQIGDGTTAAKSSPVQIGTLTTWLRVQQNSGQTYGTTFAIKTDNSLWAWGNNINGRFGNGNTIDRSSPVQVGTLTNWSRLASDGQTTLAVKTDGTLWSWGVNDVGQLGNGTTAPLGSPTSSPVQVGTLTNWSKIGMGGASQVVAIKTDGTMWGWGGGYYTFDGSTLNGSSPVQLGTQTDWADLGMGASTQWARKTTGEVFAWGMDSSLTAGVVITNITTLRKSNNTTWTSFVSGVGTSANTVIAKKSDGTIWAWGNNGSGEFGDGSTSVIGWPQKVKTTTTWNVLSSGIGGTGAINSTTGNLWLSGTSSMLGQGAPTGYSSPVQVGLTTDKFAVVSNNFNTTTAIKPDGSLWSWGTNGFGQLGDGTTNNASAPIQIGTLTSWAKVFGMPLASANGAIRSTGTLWAWGESGTLQGWTGVGFFQTPAVYPVQFGQKLMSNGSIGGINQVGSFASPNRFTSFVDTGGRLWAKGLNSSGQLGLGDTTNRTDILYQVGTLTNWASVSCGSNHTLAVKTDGTLWAWGNNDLGELGNGSTTNYSSPIQIGTLTNWSKVQAGRSFSIAIKTNGTLWTWGANANVQLGDGTIVDKSSPVQIGTVTTWSSIEKHSYGGYALRSDGSIWLWGTNQSESMATLGTQSQPAQLGTLTNWSKLAKTSAETYGLSVIKTDGTLWAWGYNNYGQLGISNTSATSSPTQVGTLTTWVDCGMAQYNSIGIRSDNTVWGAGLNSHDGTAVEGYVGNGSVTTNSNSPVQIGTWIPFGTKVISAMNGGVVLNNEGYMYSWGDNSAPNATTEYLAAYSSPVQVGTSTTWASKFIKTDGTLWTWGDNSNYGQLGQGHTNWVSAPLKVGTQTNWLQVAQGWSHTMAVKTDGTLWAIGGGNNNGQLGIGNTVNRSSPVQVGTLTNWAKVTCGESVTWALKTDGTVWSWGVAASGALGNGTTTPNRSSPVQISLPTTAVDIGGSGYTGFAVLSDGTTYGWGSNTTGRVGDGTTINRSNPVQVGTNNTWTKATQGISAGVNSGNQTINT